MSERVVYLLGAGASCGNRLTTNNESTQEFPYSNESVLPLVAEFPIAAYKALGSFIHTVRKNGGNFENEVPQKFGAWDKDIRQLTELVESSFSVDTLAKIFHLQGDKVQFRKVVNYIGVLLEYFEILKPIDNRYDAFFSSIIKMESKVPVLPHNLTILSWNYDLQIERYIQKLMSAKTLSQIDDVLAKNQARVDKFSLLKLNGDLLTEFNQNRILLNYVGGADEAQKCINLRAEEESSLGSAFLFKNIKFAWDYSTQEAEERMAVVKKAKELVVIGYSFPSFNRAADNLLLKNFAESIEYQQKARIVVQCAGSTNQVIEKIRERIITLLGENVATRIEYIPYSETREFYLSNYIEPEFGV